MTHPFDYVLLDLTGEEYLKILRYCAEVFTDEWVKKWTKRDSETGEPEFGQEIDFDKKLGPNTIGILGECALAKKEGIPVQKTLDARPKHESDLGWDIIIGGLKYDIKTPESISFPLARYRCNISRALFNKKKGNDGYIWIFMIPHPGKFPPYDWRIVGWMPKDEFFERASFHKKGDKSITGNKFKYSAPLYDMAIRHINPYKDIPR
jgi:hypothetical protein